MLLHVNNDVKIARRSTANAGLAVLGRAQTRAFGNTGGNLELDPAGVFDPAFTIANAAGLFDDLAGAATARTGLRDLEKSA